MRKHTCNVNIDNNNFEIFSIIKQTNITECILNAYLPLQKNVVVLSAQCFEWSIFFQVPLTFKVDAWYKFSQIKRKSSSLYLDQLAILDAWPCTFG